MTIETEEHISSIELDQTSIGQRTSLLEHERVVAINDIVEWNHFSVIGSKGPYAITLKAVENRVALTAKPKGAEKSITINIALASLRGVIRDYFMIYESYFDAVKTGNLPKIEAIDMSRRGLHNEGAEIVTSLLEGKVTMDSETARRLFTLICVLHLK